MAKFMAKGRSFYGKSLEIPERNLSSKFLANLVSSGICNLPPFFITLPMPDWLASLFLGLIEGLTEFIPVSSTGHLLIAEDFMRRNGILSSVLGSKDQTEIFTILIQSAAALALVPLFWGKFSGMLFRWQKAENWELLVKLGTAFMITCVAGLVFKKLNLELPETALPVAWATLIGGFVIIFAERVTSRWKMSTELTWPIVVAVAGGQILAMVFPGASRSGSTIVVALLMGLARPAATEFSFLLGVPTLLAAGGYETGPTSSNVAPEVEPILMSAMKKLLTP
jgi:undecaprenyl-diphosphatase